MAARASRTVQVNIRVEPALYRTLEALARQERRSVPQAALRLIEDGLRRQTRGAAWADDFPPQEIARLASGGGGFGWLADEPDLYGSDDGEPA